MKWYTLPLLAVVMISVTACSDDDDDPVDPGTQEFVAENADFAGYRSWTETIEPQVGPDPAGILGGAHNGNDTNMTRHIWIQDGSATRDASGNFPIGTRLVKEVRNSEGNVQVVTAMVKRGGDFNSSYNNWEWFILNANGEIQNRGGDLNNNGCNGCHAANAAKDYVFTK